MNHSMTILSSTEEDKNTVLEELMNFNTEYLHINREAYIVPMSFHMREQDRIIAGINAVMIAKSTVFVSIFWVDEAYRYQGYGSQLLKHVENESQKLGAAMIHLDTLDFQAKDFYLKCGYELFATLDDSPAKGHQRFYLKKIL